MSTASKLAGAVCQTVRLLEKREPSQRTRKGRRGGLQEKWISSKRIKEKEKERNGRGRSNISIELRSGKSKNNPKSANIYC